MRTLILILGMLFFTTQSVLADCGHGHQGGVDARNFICDGDSELQEAQKGTAKIKRKRNRRKWFNKNLNPTYRNRGRNSRTSLQSQPIETHKNGNQETRDAILYLDETSHEPGVAI